eukprot:8347311-Heterocapsa_arctica.AAC.1
MALLMVAIEQVILDRGSWQVAWMMSLMEEPPWGQLNRRPDQTRSGLRPFPRLADQTWSTT